MNSFAAMFAAISLQYVNPQPSATAITPTCEPISPTRTASRFNPCLGGSNASPFLSVNIWVYVHAINHAIFIHSTPQNRQNALAGSESTSIALFSLHSRLLRRHIVGKRFNHITLYPIDTETRSSRTYHWLARLPDWPRPMKSSERASSS